MACLARCLASAATHGCRQHAAPLQPQHRVRLWPAGAAAAPPARLRQPPLRLLQRCQAGQDPFGMPSKLFDSEMFNKEMME